MDSVLYPQIESVINTHWWFTGRLQIFDRILDHLPNTPNPGRVLDVGCGTGELGPLLQRFGRLTGIDRSETAVTMARRRGYDSAHIAEATALPFPDNHFSFVAAIDLLEHIVDDGGVGKELARVLEPDGYLLATTAAFPILWSGLDEMSHHQRRYTRKQFTDILVSAGFRPILVRYYNVFFFPFILLLRLAERFRPRHTTNTGLQELVVPPVIINSSLREVLAFERHCLAIPWPFGVSIVGLFTKPHEW